MSDLQIRAFEIEFDRLITRRERAMVKIVGKVNLGGFRRPGWTGTIDFYLFNCNTHGLVCNHLEGLYDFPGNVPPGAMAIKHKHGYQRLECPNCGDERTHREPDSAIGREELADLTKELRDMEKQ